MMLKSCNTYAVSSEGYNSHCNLYHIKEYRSFRLFTMCNASVKIHLYKVHFYTREKNTFKHSNASLEVNNTRT